MSSCSCSLAVSGDRLTLDVPSDAPEEVEFDQTLRLPQEQLSEIQKHTRVKIEDDRLEDTVHRDILDQSNFLNLCHEGITLLCICKDLICEHVIISFR